MMRLNKFIECSTVYFTSNLKFDYSCYPLLFKRKSNSTYIFSYCSGAYSFSIKNVWILCYFVRNDNFERSLKAILELSC